MRNIDLDSLQIFKAVVEQGGVSRAADRLNRVQSNVTTRVKQLEQRLGTKLFERHGRRLVPTPQGRLLLTYAERLLQLSGEAEQALRNGQPCGTLRLGTLESTAASRLPPILARYHAEHPAVQIDLVTGTSGALVSKVLAYEIEAAFVAEPFTPSGLTCRHAFTEELVLITPRTLGPIRNARELARRTVIAFTTGCSYRRILEEWLGRSGIVPSQVMEFGSYHAIVACVAAGTGIAIVPRAVLRVVQAGGELAVSPLPLPFRRARTMLVHREGHASLPLDGLMRTLPAVT
ncbi:MAG TPA: LysR family transcriptional regulator, partial [Burkholderiaceae bacterium]|nr:LysR family transcriptional regulator [Burkholderiaceae bacterium]